MKRGITRAAALLLLGGVLFSLSACAVYTPAPYGYYPYGATYVYPPPVYYGWAGGGGYGYHGRGWR